MEDVVLPTLPNYYFDPSLASLLSLVVTVLLPLVAGLVTRRHWPKQAQFFILLSVVGVKVVLELWLTALNTNEVFDWRSAIYGTLGNMVFAVLAYYGLWKGTPVQQRALDGGIVKSRVIEGQHRNGI